MYSATRDDVKKLVQQIASLAQDVVSQLDAGQNFLTPANELVKNTNTMVFALGEVFALEQSGMNKKLSAKTVSNPNRTTQSYARDSRGRFAAKQASPPKSNV